MSTPEATARELVVRWSDPTALAASGLGMSGIEFLRAIRDGDVPPPPIAQLLGFWPTLLEDGHVEFGSVPGEQHYNPIGLVHGGYAATLLDTVMGCAVQSTLPAGVAYTTLELKVNFVRPMGSDTGPVTAIGDLLHAGSRVATAEGKLVADESGKLLAHATTTALIMR